MIPGDKPVSEYPDDYQEKFLASVAERIATKLKTTGKRATRPCADLTRLPVTGAELFGRRREKEMLDQALGGETTVFSLVAAGGVGKSTLVGKWADEQARKSDVRGVRRLYGWSFYSQGSGERPSSAEQFIAAALRWFGDPDPTAGSPWTKGERLAKLVREEPTLLVLDGLEPLQWSRGPLKGQVKDPALATLVIELARDNPGLCLITSREPVTDLMEFRSSAVEYLLTQLSPEAGAQLLRERGIRGDDAELQALSTDFNNHALAVSLLGTWLRGQPGSPRAVAAAGIPTRLDLPPEHLHPYRLLAAFSQRFGDGPERELLRLLGLFDRPADPGSVAAVRAARILGLTGHLHALDEGPWRDLIDRLRDFGLIAKPYHAATRDLDTHPLVREYFGAELRKYALRGVFVKITAINFLYHGSIR